MLGIVPYRDYFMASTPLNALKSAALLSIFGNTLIISRSFAVLERALIALILYFWLARLFRRSSAAFAAVLTIVVSSGDIADPLASYNHDAILWTMAAGFTASFLLDSGKTIRFFAVCAFASGIFAGCAFATKQTIGLGATVCIPFVAAACVLRFEGWRRTAAFAALFAAGWLLCTCLLLAWITHLGVLQAMLDDIFRKGPAAKASSPLDFLTRFVRVTKELWLGALLGIAALIASLPALLRAGLRRESRNEEDRETARHILAQMLTAAIAIAAGAAASYAGKEIPGAAKPFIYTCLLGMMVLLPCYAWFWLRGNLTRREAQLCLLTTVSFVTAFMLSLSFPVFEAMLLPGAGFLTAALLDAWTGVRRAALHAICLVLLFTQTCWRLNIPYGFHGWNDRPVREARTASIDPRLRGMRFSEEAARFIDGAVRIIKQNSSSNEPIFVYPEFGLLYSLSDRTCSTFTNSHNLDVVNDDVARSEARRLLENRPAVLVYYRDSEQFLKAQEDLWRHGNRSGQRDLIAAIDSLAEQYRLAATFELLPERAPVRVYVRRQPIRTYAGRQTR